LFENFFVMERVKYLSNNSIYRNLYFCVLMMVRR